MFYILIVLIQFTMGSPVSIVAEFNTADACRAAIDAILAPFERDVEYGRVWSSQTCVLKGQKDFGAT